MRRGFFFLLLLDCSQVFSAISFEDAVFPELIVSGRALAMGNAFINRADDSVAVFYNPAGLGSVRWAHLHLNNLHMEINKGFLQSTTGGKLFDISDTLSKAHGIEKNRQLLLENRGTTIHNRFQVMPNLTSRYFSMGYMVSYRNKSRIGVEDDAQFEYAFRQDQGPYLSLNLSLFGGIFKLGASGVLLNRKELIDQSDPLVPLELDAGDYRSGAATIVTSGVRVVLPFALLPTFSAKINNTLDSEFVLTAGPRAPRKILKSIDAGFSITPQVGSTTRIHLEINYKDATNLFPDVALSRKLLLGMEIDMMRVMFVRLGYGDGFGSIGVGIRAKKLEFDLTTYAVDNSSTTFRGDEDRRFSMTISSGF